MTLIIIFLKLYHVLNSINSLVDKKYFLFYINNIIDSQREIKTQFNELNNHDIVVIGNDPLLFLRIYTKTKVSQGILVNKTIILDGNLTNMLEDLGENYILSKDFKELSEIYDSGQENIDSQINNNINNLLPFYYHFSLIFIDSLNN